MVTKRETIESLRSECLSRYLNKSSSNYFTAPEYYSPLYRVLYEALINNETPPYLERSKIDSVKNDIDSCETSFDRYLVALYPSRFEASNPLPLSDREAKKENLYDYLCAEYKKTTSDIFSYNYDREVKYISEFVNAGIWDDLKANAKSALYKILVLSYKLSLINNNWRSLIRYIDPGSDDNSSMDNVVDFNKLNDEKARENSALVKMFYFEIDQGKGDGDETQSRRVSMLSYAYEELYKNLKIYIYSLFVHDVTVREVKALADYLVKSFVVNSIELKYKDKNQELFDVVQCSVLKNLSSNSLLAKKKFESSSGYKDLKVINENNWILMPHDKDDMKKLLSHELDVGVDVIGDDFFLIASTLQKLFAASGKTFPESECATFNISCLIVCNVKINCGFHIKSKIQGSKNNNYNPMAELERAHKWLVINDPCMKDKHNLSLLRPTTLHYFEYAFDQAIWSMDCGALKFSHMDHSIAVMRDIVFNVIIGIMSKLRNSNHVECLSSIDDFCRRINKNFKLDDGYLRSFGDDDLLSKCINRHGLYWSPL